MKQIFYLQALIDSFQLHVDVIALIIIKIREQVDMFHHIDLGHEIVSFLLE